MSRMDLILNLEPPGSCPACDRFVFCLDLPVITEKKRASTAPLVVVTVSQKLCVLIEMSRLLLMTGTSVRRGVRHAEPLRREDRGELAVVREDAAHAGLGSEVRDELLEETEADADAGPDEERHGERRLELLEGEESTDADDGAGGVAHPSSVL